MRTISRTTDRLAAASTTILLGAACALLSVPPLASAAEGPSRPQLVGSLAWVAPLPDGFLVRWTRPQHPLLSLEAPGLPAVPVDAAGVVLPAGHSAWVEVVAVEGARRSSETRAPSATAAPEGFEIVEWRRAVPESLAAHGLASEQQGDAALGAPLGLAGPGTAAPLQEVYGSDASFPGRLVMVRPVETQRDMRLLPLRVYPEQYNPQRRQVLRVSSLLLAVHLVPEIPEDDAHTSLEPAPVGSRTSPSTAGSMAVDTAPASSDGNPTLKLSIPADGLYEVTPAELTGAGFDLATLDASTLKVFSGGGEVPSLLTGNGDTVLDAGERLLFYAERAAADFAPFPYRYNNVAWVVSGGAAATRMSSRDATPTGVAETFFVDTIEPVDPCCGINDLILTSDSLSSDGDYYHWKILGSGTGFAPDSFDIVFDTSHAVDAAGSATLSVHLFGRRFVSGDTNLDGPHHTRILWNGTEVDNATWGDLVAYEPVISLNDADVVMADPNVPNVLTVILENDTAMNTIYVNKAVLEYRRDFTVTGDRLAFSGAGPATYTLTGFSGSDVQVYDVTDSAAPVLLGNVSVAAGAVGFDASFSESSSGQRSYLALTTVARLSTPAITVDTSSDLTNTATGADWIAIAPPELQAALAPLVAHRAGQGLRTLVVSPEDIFDEFNAGVYSPRAIQDFLAFAYSSWTAPPPSHVLLVGDANQDHFDFLAFGGDLVPTWFQLITSKFGPRMTGSDHAFGALSGSDNLLEVAVGRLPARDAGQVTAMVDKILAYETSPPLAALNRGVLLVADDIDAAGPFDYPGASDARCAQLAATHLSCIKTYLPDFASASAMQGAVSAQTEAGALLLNYHGSANARQWGFDVVTGDGVLGFYDKPSIQALDNGAVQPFVISHATQNALFAAPSGPMGNVAEEGSMMETYMRRAGQGGIASMGPANGAIFSHMDMFASKLFDEFFVQGNLVIGEALRVAKNRAIVEGAVPDDSMRMLALLGDPATELPLAPDSDGDSVPDFSDCAPANAALSDPNSDVPGEVSGPLVYTDEDTFTWGMSAKASAYNVYRGVHDSGSAWSWNQTCIASATPMRTHTDTSIPSLAGRMQFYLPTGMNECGEGPLGFTSSGAPRGLGAPCGTSTADFDGDGIENLKDNCAAAFNPGQEDADRDNFGDACDTCPADYNPDQADLDADGVGDICDNCAFPNPSQDDRDSDGVGDACLLAVNFQPSSAATPADHLADSGAIFSETTGFGWDSWLLARERDCEADQALDTFLFTSNPRTWEVTLENGTYHVSVFLKDCFTFQAAQRVVVEDNVVVNDQDLPQGVLLQQSTEVQIVDGRLTVTIGGSGFNTILNKLLIERQP